MHPGLCTFDCTSLPLGTVVGALFIALLAALKQGRRRSRDRDLKGAWMLWLFGPATVVCVLGTAYLARVACAEVPSGAQRRHFDLASGPAADRLEQFASQAGLSVMFDYSGVKEHTVRRVSGDLQPAQALTRMLKDSGLEFVFSTPSTITVRERAAKGNPTPPVDSSDLEQVLIMGVEPHDVAVAAGTRVDVEYATEISAFMSASDWLSTLPQVFGGGATEDTHQDREASTNTSYGEGINLRGLGSRATLVLVNGQRLAPSGSAGAFTDITTIPVSAIDHIQIVSDAASVEYGADAVGGAVNFALRGERSGSTSEARLGGVTKGSLREQLFSHSQAMRWDDGGASLSVEYYERDPLPASARLQATSDLRPLGGSNFDELNSNPGTLVDSRGQLWAIPSGQNGSFLRPWDLIPGRENLHDQYAGTWILPHQRRLSALATGQQRLNETLTASFDALFGRREVDSRVKGLTAALMVPATNPFYVNPISGDSSPVEVLYALYKDLGPVESHGIFNSGQYVLALDWDPGPGWRLQAHIGYASSDEKQVSSNLANFQALQRMLADPNPLTAFNPFGDGSNTDPATLAAIRTRGTNRSFSAVRYANVRATSFPFQWPSGAVKLITGAEGRVQTLSSFADPLYLSSTPATQRGRTVSALFAEAELPILGPKLLVSTGIRQEHYSDVGGAVVPAFGFHFTPWTGLSLQGSWARMFVAPTLADLSETNNISELFLLPDSRSISGYSTTLVWAGNNAHLGLERATSWDLQLTFAPANLPGLSAGITYFNTVFANQIYRTPNLSMNILTDPGQSWLVTRTVTPAQRAQICGNSRFIGNQPDCLNADIESIVDMRLRNMERLITDGFDLSGHYRLDLPVGHLSFGLNATYVLRYAEALSPTAPIVNVRNTPHNPPGLRFRGMAGWERRGLSGLLAMNYQSGYRDVFSIPNRPVDSWATFDASIGYRWPVRTGYSKEWDVFIVGRNVFNSNPPFVNDSLYGIGYDPENGDLLGRRVSLNLSLKM